MLVETLTALLVVFAAYVYYQLYLHPLAKYPGPPLAALTDLYHAYLCSTLRRNEYLDRLHEKYGDCFRLQSNMLYINTADSIHEIYRNRDFLKAPRYKTVETADNIFTVLDPKEYARRHRLIAPAFSAKSIDKFENQTTRPLINQWIQALRQRLDEQKGTDASDVVNFTDWTDFIVTDIVGSVVFGESFGFVEQLEKNPGLHLIQNVLMAMSTISCMPNLVWFLPLIVSPKALYKGYLFSEGIKKRVKACIERQKNGDEAALNSICGMLRNTKDETGDRLEVVEIVDECHVFCVAGSDTTSVAITNCLFYLAKHVDKQTKLAEEIRGAFETSDDIRSKVLAKLPYLQACISEGMRIWPSAVGHMERINYKEDTMISGFHVPKGCEISSNFLHIARDSRYFHDPLEYKPERWIDPDCKDNLEASQPMQVGPRRCIGQNLGWQEMRLIVANLLWHFELTQFDKVLDNRDATATWRGKIRMHVNPRPPKSVSVEAQVEKLAI